MATSRQSEKVFFGDQALDRGSARNWVVGEGHVALPEARQKALDDLAQAEADLVDKQAALMQATEDRTAAIRRRDAAYNARQDARLKVKRAQERVAYVCSTDEPMEA